MELTVLYLDNHLLVVDKPAGMLVQGDSTGDLDLLTAGKQWLKERFDKPGNVFLGLVHRLDRPVSGVLVFARTSKSAARLSDQFRRRLPEKDYVTIVEGKLQGQGKLVDYLLKEGNHVRVVAADTPRAKRAILRYETISALPDRSLVRVRLLTGRAHQIRVQLAGLGHPIMGDIRYGSSREFDGRNLALHGFSMALDHPTRGERMKWTSRPPAVWTRAFGGSIERLLETE